MSYLVTVKHQGKAIKKIFVPFAESVLDACNIVEANMKLRPVIGTVNPETGKLAHVRWHGYEFSVRAVMP